MIAARVLTVALIVGASMLGIPAHQVAAETPTGRYATVVVDAPAPTAARAMSHATALPWRANLLALSWRSSDPSADGVDATVRTRAGGRWSEPIAFPVEDDEGPDAGTEPDASDRAHTLPIWGGTVDAVSVSVEVTEGAARVRDIRLHAINTLGDAEPQPIVTRAVRAVGRFLTATPAPAHAVASTPSITSRAQWGADESLRSPGPGEASELKLAIVHHTAGNNTYTRSQAAGVVRGIYEYHTKALGYSDIAYNFLIDRYGKVYEGRKGGVAKAIIGAHAGGFNTATTGVALMGDFTSATPPSAMQDALVHLLAWKLDRHFVPPTGKVLMVAGRNGTKYEEGEEVRLHRISGHRQVSATGCPGSVTFNLLSSIRNRVEGRGNPKIYRPRITTDVLRPDGDGQLDTARLRAEFSRTVDWSWTISDPAGRMIWSVSGHGNEMDQTFFGLDADGRALASGAYSWRLEAQKGSKVARRATGVLSILVPEPGGCGGCFAGASADFNGDGFGDLATGAAGEAIGSRDDAGGVHVLYGGPGGLTADDDDFFYEDVIGLDPSEPGDGFGATLASGDFDGDSFDDLAIAAPREDRGPYHDAGAITILYGGEDGLGVDRAQHLTRDDLVGEQDQATADAFGASLAAGDFNDDGKADLVVGIPGADRDGKVDPGQVAVFSGSVDGLVALEGGNWHQGRAGIWSAPQHGDRFGAAVTSADVNKDGFDDAVIGVPGESIKRRPDAGAVHVLYGSDEGIQGKGAARWHQDLVDSGDAAEAGDRVGFALAAGDVDGDGAADIAVGVPGEEIGSVGDAGAVFVLRGSKQGTSFPGPQLWHAGAVDLPGEAALGDGFGSVLSFGDLDDDGTADLIVGVPGDDVDALSDAGSLSVLYGSVGGGLIAIGSQMWHEDSPGIRGVAAAWDGFAWSVATGDLNGDGYADLIVGVPGEDVGAAIDAGAVNVIFGSEEGLTATADERWHQDSPGVRNKVESGDLLGSV